MLYGSKYFSIKEFACKCGCGLGTQESDIVPDLVYGLHLLRAKLALAFTITSGCRCIKHNTAVKGGLRSTHVPGVVAQTQPEWIGKCRAADIDTSLWSTVTRAEAIVAALGMGMRVGIATTFLHFDVESAPFYSEGVWNYGSSENSSN